ncbi:MAG: hypothetical protein PWQ88_581 [Candidatus Methanomethylophilaceae archaeon]|nr:hypothetical protein [Candidatus Methanomethylophilaceae archaeon]MDI3541584.1 hypothetical protein [Candidatus Methanomethylophilaceae archaeon]
MEIRHMEMKDLKAVRDLELLCIREYFEKIMENKWEDLPKEFIDSLGASNPRSFRHYVEEGTSFVAEEDGIAVGFIFAKMVHHIYNVENMLWVENMGVDPYYRRLGIAYRMLQRCIEEGKRLGATVVHSAIQPDNLPSLMLHRKLGFFTDSREVALLDLEGPKPSASR